MARSSAGTYSIVFLSQGIDAELGALYLFDPKTAQRRLLTSEPGDYRFPRWSPDGTGIVFRDVTGGASADLVLISADGSGATTITQGEAPVSGDRPPAWSADGANIAFASLRESSAVEAAVWRLWVTTPLATELAPLLPQVAGSQFDSAWAPDGTGQLVYGRGSQSAATALWLTDVARGDEGTNLTENRVYGISSPAWSPDGTRVAFAGYPIGADGMIEGLGSHSGAGMGVPTAELFMVDVTSGAFTRLTDNQAEDDQPSWSPDGKSLLFSSDRDGDRDLWLMPLDSPADAMDLIDDNTDPREDSMGHWYVDLALGMQ